MKKTFRTLAILLLAGFTLYACDKKPNDNTGDGGGGGGEDLPDVTIEEPMVSGAIKAGMAEAIEIIGGEFNPDDDYIYAGFMDGGEMHYERITNDVLTIRSGRIAFGFKVDASYLNKTVKIYLNRRGFNGYLPITGDITFTMPTVEEGYIPDPGFRATLMSPHPDQGNPKIAELFDTYGMLDVAAAKKLKHGGHSSYPLNLYACTAYSLEGIELFESISGVVSGWDMPNVKEIDLSKWTAKGVDFRCERSGNLEKLVAPPYSVIVICHSCPKLTHVDVSGCKWLKRLNITDRENGSTGNTPSAVTYFDIRRGHWEKYSDYPSEEDEYCMLGGACGWKLPDNALVKLDSWILWNHIAGSDSDWDDIYDAWKRGATIEVYSRVKGHFDEKLATVPSFEEDPNALSPDNKLEDSTDENPLPSNKFQVNDPYTDVNEAPVPYVPPGK